MKKNERPSRRSDQFPLRRLPVDENANGEQIIPWLHYPKFYFPEDDHQ